MNYKQIKTCLLLALVLVTNSINAQEIYKNADIPLLNSWSSIDFMHTKNR